MHGIIYIEFGKNLTTIKEIKLFKVSEDREKCIEKKMEFSFKLNEVKIN